MFLKGVNYGTRLGGAATWWSTVDAAAPASPVRVTPRRPLKTAAAPGLPSMPVAPKTTIMGEFFRLAPVFQ